MLAHWSSQQSNVAFSSGEAELNASVKGICEGRGIANMIREMKRSFKVKVLIDSSAAKGILQRTGCGKVKHLEARQLWVQESVAQKKTEIQKIPRAIRLRGAD